MRCCQNIRILSRDPVPLNKLSLKLVRWDLYSICTVQECKYLDIRVDMGVSGYNDQEAFLRHGNIKRKTLFLMYGGGLKLLSDEIDMAQSGANRHSAGLHWRLRRGLAYSPLYPFLIECIKVCQRDLALFMTIRNAIVDCRHEIQCNCTIWITAKLSTFLFPL